MSDISPRMADFIRKVVAYSVTGIGTWFLLRVLFRAANGKGSWLDPELWVFFVLGAAMTLWVIVAKPVRRTASRPPKGPLGDEAAPVATPSEGPELEPKATGP